MNKHDENNLGGVFFRFIIMNSMRSYVETNNQTLNYNFQHVEMKYKIIFQLIELIILIFFPVFNVYNFQCSSKMSGFD